ncbi:hypothetical protein [Pseudonocardia sp. T1-2H]|uniref:hypothetical protein n=1 Tax=Pseudonocardia sp. T1-2H TaxID=3128899 RepID=UPI003100C4FF
MPRIPAGQKTITMNASRDDKILDEWVSLRDFYTFEQFAARIGLTVKAWESLYDERKAAGDGRATGRAPARGSTGLGVRTGTLRLPGTHR